MVNAKEARKTAALNKEWLNVETAINDAIASGKMNAKVNYYVQEEISKKLVQLGYEVSKFFDCAGRYTYISWKKE